tara:strand:- start:730 stop:1005 length:276 start_codon:yes stop_codon:yes gene_type:complete
MEPKMLWTIMENQEGSEIVTRHSFFHIYEMRLKLLIKPSHFGTRWLGEIFNSSTGNRIVSIKFHDMLEGKRYLSNRVVELTPGASNGGSFQ